MNVRAILKYVWIIVLSLIICNVVLALSFDLFLKATTKPAAIDWTPERQRDVYNHIGVKVPESAQYVEGREYSGRDLSYVFIFKFSCDSFRENQQDADSFVREQFQMDDENFSPTYEEEPYAYGPLTDFDYTFTHMIDPEKPWAKICYCIEDDVMYVALYYGIP